MSANKNSPRTVVDYPIVGIGVSVLDSICTMKRYPKQGEVVRASERREAVGGGVAVAIATAARLGSSTALIDALGDDTASTQILARLKRETVDVQWIQQHENHTASVASIWSDSETSERTIVYCPGSACEQIQWDESLTELLSTASIVHLNGRHLALCKTAIEVARRSNTLLSFDGGAYRYRDEILPVLRAAHVVVVARQFAESHCRQFLGPQVHETDSAELAAALMNDLQCKVVGVTDGARGSDWIHEGRAFHQPAEGVELAVDTTGCGDTFHGAFLHEFNQGGTVQQAAAFAARVAGMNARFIGALSDWSRQSVLP